MKGRKGETQSWSYFQRVTKYTQSTLLLSLTCEPATGQTSHTYFCSPDPGPWSGKSFKYFLITQIFSDFSNIFGTVKYFFLSMLFFLIADKSFQLNYVYLQWVSQGSMVNFDDVFYLRDHVLLEEVMSLEYHQHVPKIFCATRSKVLLFVKRHLLKSSYGLNRLDLYHVYYIRPFLQKWITFLW